MSEKLKPCPFCGGSSSFSSTGGSDERTGYNFTFSIRCDVCPASVVVGSNSDENGWRNETDLSVRERAFEAWNRRHQEQETSSEFERLLAK
jgi:hypothetical protein